MRDDIAALFEALLLLKRKKLSHLEKLYYSNCEKRNLLKSGAHEEAAQKAEKDLILIQDIDLIDAEITKQKEKIAAKCGISPLDFHKKFSSVSHFLIDEYVSADMQIRETAKKAMAENELYLKELECAISTTGNDIEELRRIIFIVEKIRPLC